MFIFVQHGNDCCTLHLNTYDGLSTLLLSGLYHYRITNKFLDHAPRYTPRREETRVGFLYLLLHNASKSDSREQGAGSLPAHGFTFSIQIVPLLFF